MSAVLPADALRRTLDSFEFNGENNPNRKNYGDEQFMFGDVGMIYVWFCFNCLTPHATTEGY